MISNNGPDRFVYDKRKRRNSLYCNGDNMPNYTLQDERRSKGVILTNELVSIFKGYEMLHP